LPFPRDRIYSRDSGLGWFAQRSAGRSKLPYAGAALSADKKFSQAIPESIQNYVNIIAKSGLANKIILFGSRARGDHRENSDFDIAVECNKNNKFDVLKLKSRLMNEALTLYKIDLLDMNTAGADYLTEIKSEGQLLWQKKD
jgi:predicted nucleotidyltransferase